MNCFNDTSIRVITTVYSKRNCTICTHYKKTWSLYNEELYDRLSVCKIRHKKLILCFDIPTKVAQYVIISLLASLCKSFRVSFYFIPRLQLCLFLSWRTKRYAVTRCGGSEVTRCGGSEVTHSVQSPVLVSTQYLHQTPRTGGFNSGHTVTLEIAKHWTTIIHVLRNQLRTQNFPLRGGGWPWGYI